MSKFMTALLGAVIAFTTAGAAFAQTTPQSSSTGNATVTTNVTAVSSYPTSGDSGSNPSGDYTTHTKQSGSLYTTPSVAGSYFSGANPCLIGVGGGGAGGPIGFSLSFGRNDEGCQRRSDAAAWHALGFDNAAIARLCQDEDNKKAFEATGNLCPNNYRMAGTTTVANPVAAPVAAPPTAPLKPRRDVPTWCATASTNTALNAAYVQYACGD